MVDEGIIFDFSNVLLLLGTALSFTAASCFFDELRKEFIDASEFKIAAGKFYRVFDSPDDPYAQKSSVKYISYNWNYKADMALVRVEPFKINALVKPVCVDGDFTGRSEYSLSGKIAKVGTERSPSDNRHQFSSRVTLFDASTGSRTGRKRDQRVQ